MKNNELITELSSRLGWTPEDVTEMVTAFVSVVGSRLVDNDVINLTGLGLFEAKKRTERIALIPTSGKRYLIPPKLAPTFKPGVIIKSKIKELSENE